MDKKRKIKVALIYDLPDWVLGETALFIEDHLNQRSTILEIRSYQTPKNYFQLLKIEIKNDIIHFLSPWDYYRYYDAILKPSVVTIHHLVTYENFQETIYRARAICTPSLQWYDRLTNNLVQKKDCVFVTPPLIDCELFKPMAGARENLISRLQCPSSTILLGFAAKKTSDESGRKGFDRLLKLLECLKENNEIFLLLIFGVGWKLEDIPQELQDSVRLVGFIDAKERPFYFGALDYYLCLSRIEGGPYPVLECMAAGIKTISTPVGIVPEIISHEVNGFIVDGDNYLLAIPEILSKWSGDTAQSRLLKANARTAVVEKFSRNKSASPAIYEPIYEYALKNSPPSNIYERVTLQAHLFHRLWQRVF